MKLRLNSGGKNEHRSYGYHDTSQLPRTAQLRLAQWLGEHEGHDRRRSRLWIIGLGGFQGLPELLPPENAPMPTMHSNPKAMVREHLGLFVSTLSFIPSLFSGNLQTHGRM